jgi:hypothetical protein
MNYIIKVISPDGVVNWICQTKFDGLRVFGKRESAETFTTTLAALAAINSLPRVLEAAGMSFAIETADPFVSMPS